MNRLPFLVPSLAALCCAAVACDSPRTATEASDPNPTAATSVPAAGVSFQKDLNDGDYRFSVRTMGAGSQRQLIMRAEKLGRELVASTANIEGMVQDAVVTNLNKDNYPELLVFVNDAGGGSYGRLIGYEFLSRGRRDLTLPALEGPAAEGYLGHDSFRVDDRKIIRSFPIYRPNDPNSTPSGGTRVIEYEMPKQEGLLTMVGHQDQP